MTPGMARECASHALSGGASLMRRAIGVGATDWAAGWAGDMASGMAEQAIPILEEYINNVS